MKKYKIFRRKIERKVVYFDSETFYWKYEFVKRPWELYAEVTGVKAMIYVLFDGYSARWNSTVRLEEFMKKRIVFDMLSEPAKFDPNVHDCYYLIRDEKDNVINPYQMMKPYFKNKRHKYTYYWSVRRGIDYKFRKGPVPGTGTKNRWHFPNYYRTFPKNSRTNPEVIDEIREYTRNYKVKDHEVPNTWDDIPRGDCRNRNWKRHREKQYKHEGKSYKVEDVEFNIEELREELVKDGK